MSLPKKNNSAEPLSNQCPLCGGTSSFYLSFRKKDYYRCLNCQGVFLNPQHILSHEEEKKRYEQHNNDVCDPKYRKFVSPLVELVQKNFTKEDQGLDFGCGTGPVITELLRESGYKVSKYDPFFYNDEKALTGLYDYIICCEVIEHFSKPQKEFTLLRSLLKPGGILYCMTEHLSDEIDFSDWYYKNDPTHLFFYHRESYNWIQQNCGYKSFTINGRIVEFT